MVRIPRTLVFLLASLVVASTAVGQDDPWKSEYSQAATAFLMGHYPRAETHVREALRLSEPFGESDERRIDTRRLYAHVQGVKGNDVESEAVFRDVLNRAESSTGADSSLTGNAVYDLGVLYVKLGRTSEARPLIQRSLEIRKKHNSGDHLHVAASMNKLAQIHQAEGRRKEAEKLYLETLEMLSRLGRTGLPGAGPTQNNLALLYDEMGRDEEAETFHKRAIRLAGNARGKNHPVVARFSRDLGRFYLEKKRYGDAVPLFETAVQIYRASLGDGHVQVHDTLVDHAKALRGVGRGDEAAVAESEAAKIAP